MKKRLDELLVERGLAQSRSRAQALILAGVVLVNDSPATKAGVKFSEEVSIRVKTKDHPYVSRGGLKLAGALEAFSYDPKGRIAMDVGSSTGGFCDVLLRADVVKIHAVDVGHGQMDWKIRSDPRVCLHEGVNARSMPYSEIGETVDLFVVDVSFISLGKILPNLKQFARPGAVFLTLIKPQFEAGPEAVGKGGIVTDPAVHEKVLARVREELESHGFQQEALIKSSILGTDGNTEFFSKWTLK